MREILTGHPFWLIKRPLRQARAFLEGRARIRALRGLVEVLRTWAPAEGLDPLVLQDLRLAWGNDAYATDLDFLAAVAERVMVGPGPFLECGSGISTVVAAALADRHGSFVWSLEQDGGWHARLRTTLATLGLANVELWHAPLRIYSDFVWVELRDRRLPARFSHVFCDGPAVLPTAWAEPFWSSWRARSRQPLLVPVGCLRRHMSAKLRSAQFRLQIRPNSLRLHPLQLTPDASRMAPASSARRRRRA